MIYVWYAVALAAAFIAGFTCSTEYFRRSPKADMDARYESDNAL